MLELTQQNDLRELLKESIRLLKRKKPNLTSSALANYLDISGSTFSRIENGDVRKPDVHHVSAIITATHDIPSAKAVIEKFYPELSKGLDRVYKGNAEVPFVPVETEKFFCDTGMYELLVSATSRAGISRSSVQAEYGNKGVLALDELISKGVLEEINGQISLRGSVNATQSTVHQLAQNLIANNYDLESFGRKENWLSLQYESVNLDKAMPEIRKVLEDAAAKLRTIFRNPDFQGDDVVWAALASDTLIKQGLSKEVLQ